MNNQNNAKSQTHSNWISSNSTLIRMRRGSCHLHFSHQMIYRKNKTIKKETKQNRREKRANIYLIFDFAHRISIHYRRGAGKKKSVLCFYSLKAAKLRAIYGVPHARNMLMFQRRQTHEHCVDQHWRRWGRWEKIFIFHKISTENIWDAKPTKLQLQMKN